MAGPSKNNPGTRQEQKKKFYQGSEVKPCLYDGRAIGKGKYMAGHINGELITDVSDKPMHLGSIPLD